MLTESITGLISSVGEGFSPSLPFSPCAWSSGWPPRNSCLICLIPTSSLPPLLLWSIAIGTDYEVIGKATSLQLKCMLGSLILPAQAYMGTSSVLHYCSRAPFICCGRFITHCHALWTIEGIGGRGRTLLSYSHPVGAWLWSTFHGGLSGSVGFIWKVLSSSSSPWPNCVTFGQRVVVLCLAQSMPLPENSLSTFPLRGRWGGCSERYFFQLYVFAMLVPVSLPLPDPTKSWDLSSASSWQGSKQLSRRTGGGEGLMKRCFTTVEPFPLQVMYLSRAPSLPFLLWCPLFSQTPLSRRCYLGFSAWCRFKISGH